MRYVILRDDDTNALTPVGCLERLYRPFLERGLPVNLAVIPHVRTDVKMPDGRLEGFLGTKNGHVEPALPIGTNLELVDYLRTNRGYHIVQHGYHHDYFEFDRIDGPEIERRLKQGTTLLTKAGFPAPQTFVAPYDKLSRASLKAVARRFAVLSTGWFELRRLPPAWWPLYALKKMLKRSHWRVRRTLLLTHPGCLLSCHRPYRTMMDEIKRVVENSTLTVLVTHWWEYFRNGTPDPAFIGVLHQAADYLSRDQNIRVVSFDDLAQSRVLLG
jgi:hypothetical protein